MLVSFSRNPFDSVRVNIFNSGVFGDEKINVKGTVVLLLKLRQTKQNSKSGMTNNAEKRQKLRKK